MKKAVRLIEEADFELSADDEESMEILEKSILRDAGTEAISMDSGLGRVRPIGTPRNSIRISSCKGSYCMLIKRGKKKILLSGKTKKTLPRAIE